MVVAIAGDPTTAIAKGRPALKKTILGSIPEILSPAFPDRNDVRDTLRRIPWPEYFSQNNAGTSQIGPPGRIQQSERSRCETFS
jgi:hypothetical protein